MPVFKPSNELTFTTVCADRRRLIKYLQNHLDGDLYFDLQQVTLCDSAGLAFLIEAKRLCQQFSKSLSIENMSKEIYALVEFCGVQHVLC